MSECRQALRPARAAADGGGRENLEKRCILVCAGDFTPVEIRKGEEDCLIAVDDGFTYLLQMGILPDLCIGDFDSLQPQSRDALEEIRRQTPERIVTLPVEKDDTDTMAAVRIGLRKGYLRFDIYGALGGERISHTIANLQVLNFIKDQGGQGYIMDARQMLFLVRNETREFHQGFHGEFSVFAVDPIVKGVTLKGMKYELENGTLSNAFPIGCSNEIAGGEKASVTVSEGTALVVVEW